MKRISETFSHVRKDFLEGYHGMQAVRDRYLPVFFNQLVATPAADALSADARALLVTEKAVEYVRGLAWMHNTLANLFAHSETRKDPRYVSLQHAESQCWLLVHLMDELADIKHAHAKIEPAVLIEHVNTLLFGSTPPQPLAIGGDMAQAVTFAAHALRHSLDELGSRESFRPYWDGLVASAVKETTITSMREHKHARREVGLRSGLLCYFFISGAGDEAYAKQHYGDQLSELRRSCEKFGIGGIFFDSYLDFKHDKANTLKGLKPSEDDKSWFLSSGLRQSVGLLGELPKKHAGFFAGTTVNFLHRLNRKLFVTKLTGHEHAPTHNLPGR